MSFKSSQWSDRNGCFCSGESADSLRPFRFADSIGRGCFVLPRVAAVGGVVPWAACSSEEQADRKVQTDGNHGAETLTGEAAVRYARMLCDGDESIREKFQYYTCRGEVRIGDLRTQLSDKLTNPDVVELLATDQGIMDATRQGVAVISRGKCIEGSGYLLEMLHAGARRVERFRSSVMAERPKELVISKRTISVALCQGGYDLFTDG